VGLPPRLLKRVGIVVAPLVVVIPVAAFVIRTTSQRIDRLNFLDAFLHDVSDWTIFNWLFGSVPITPLSAETCRDLSFYEKLFSTAGDGSCYSVIYHAFVLRVLFDSGILGLLLVFGGAWVALMRARVKVGLAVFLVAVAGANSLSVSGLNSPYVLLPILIAILLAGEPEKIVRSMTVESGVPALRRDLRRGGARRASAV
jgi:hypothetical protein